MSFVIAPSPRYFAPASFETLTADGELVVHKFDLEFKRLSLTELRQLEADVAVWNRAAQAAVGAAAAKSAGGLPQTPDAKASVNYQVLERVQTGWRAVQDAKGVDLAYSMDAVVATEEKHPGFMNACVRAFWMSTMPREAAHLAAEKNSETSPGAMH